MTLEKNKTLLRAIFNKMIDFLAELGACKFKALPPTFYFFALRGVWGERNLQEDTNTFKQVLLAS